MIRFYDSSISKENSVSLRNLLSQFVKIIFLQTLIQSIFDLIFKKTKIQYFCSLLVLTLLFVGKNTSIQAQTCCTNEVYPNNGFETTITPNAKFPNATISTANNALSFTAGTTSFGGWYLGTNQTVPSGYMISDATRASEGSQFWYVPKAPTNTGNNNSVCAQNLNTLTNTAIVKMCAKIKKEPLPHL